MTFEVRPCADLDEFSQALLAIGQYFNLEATSDRLQRFSSTEHALERKVLREPVEPVAGGLEREVLSDRKHGLRELLETGRPLDVEAHAIFSSGA